MNNISLLVLSFLLLMPTGNLKAQQTPHSTDIKITVKANFLLYLPKGYSKRSKESYPLLIFLHGSGERGSKLDSVKKHGPPRLINEGKNFPFIVVSPQCPEGQWWKPEELNVLIDIIVKKYKVDEDRIYMTGLSMGGFGTWSYVSQFPHRLAAIAPICGGGDPFLAFLFKDVPAWIFHGEKDPVVLVEQSKAMAEALKKAGGEVKLTLYPEAGHDCWTETYNNPDLYDWLLQHKKTK